MGKKEERLLICILIIMSVSAIIWCLMDNSTCKQKMNTPTSTILQGIVLTITAPHDLINHLMHLNQETLRFLLENVAQTLLFVHTIPEIVASLYAIKEKFYKINYFN